MSHSEQHLGRAAETCEGQSEKKGLKRPRDLHFETIAIHAGQPPDPSTGAVAVPLVLSTTFAQRTPGEHAGSDLPSSYGAGFDYARTNNPTRGALENCLAACERGKHCIAFGSGMAAIAGVVQGLLKTGDRCIVVDDVYGGTQRLFKHVFGQAGVLHTLCDVTVPEMFEKELRLEPPARMVWIESPTNPSLKICDISAIATLAKKYGCLLVVDNTWATPLLQQPLTLGADIVVHSSSKYIGGHSDMIGGAVVTDSADIAGQIRRVQNSLGAVPSPFDCFLALRGLKTLSVRMAAHQRNAQLVAEFLDGSAGVSRVLYPGLPSHPQHELASRQMRGFGGVVSFVLQGGRPQAEAFFKALELFTVAESLGAVESLAGWPAMMSHHSVAQEQRENLGITDGFVRLSVGLEAAEDLIEDLEHALQTSLQLLSTGVKPLATALV